MHSHKCRDAPSVLALVEILDSETYDMSAEHERCLTVELSGAYAGVWAWHFIFHASALTSC